MDLFQVSNAIDVRLVIFLQLYVVLIKRLFAMAEFTETAK